MFNQVGKNQIPSEELLASIPPTKEPGLYELVTDTVNILIEASRMLDIFSGEIACASNGEVKRGSEDPHCFTDSVHLAHALALGLRSDLDALISKFR